MINARAYYLFVLVLLLLACCYAVTIIYSPIYESLSLDQLSLYDQGLFESADPIDDSFKYLKSLESGQTLLVYHGGLGLEIYTSLVKALPIQTREMTALIILQNLVLIVGALILLSAIKVPHWMLFSSLPYLGYISATLNKEAYTFFSLSILLFWVVSIGSTRVGPNSKSFSSRRILATIFMILSFVPIFATLCSRPSLFLLLFLVSLVMSCWKIFLRLRIATSSLLFLFCLLALTLCIIYAAIAAPDYGKLLFSWAGLFSNTPSAGVISSHSLGLLERLLGSLYFVSVPFPFGILVIPDSYLSAYLWFSYIFLSSMGVFRMIAVAKVFCSPLEAGKFFSGPSGILLAGLLIACIGIGAKGDEVTRQLITIVLPLSYAMSLQKLPQRRQSASPS
jgi:hypothetical protein